MADVQLNGARTFTVNAANQYILGDVGDRGGVITIHLVSSSFSGTIGITGRLRGQSAFVAIPYTSLHLNGAVGTGAIVSTGITGTSLIQVVVADGMDIAVNCSAFTSGSMAGAFFPSVGAA